MVDRFDIMVPDPLTRERYTDKVSMAVETVYHVLDYEAIDEAHLMHVPTLVLAVNGDVLVPTEQASAYYERLAGPKKLHIFRRGSHFSVYDELLQEVADLTIDWFEGHCA
jgi:esterase/lipase